MYSDSKEDYVLETDNRLLCKNKRLWYVLNSFDRGGNDFHKQVIHAISETALFDQPVLHLYKALDQNAMLRFVQIQIMFSL